MFQLKIYKKKRRRSAGKYDQKKSRKVTKAAENYL